jgi:N-acetylglucosamine kinase-like BadF-type ATPase
MVHQGVIFIGLDAGGTACRWTAVDTGGQVQAQAQVTGFSGMNLASEAGRLQLSQALDELRSSMGQRLALNQVHGVYAGVTGVSEPQAAASRELAGMLARALNAPQDGVQCHSDMDIAFRAAHEPGGGYLVYAGTGSIASYIDEAGVWHRAGGRGFVLGDEGGGYWIAKQALATIWRREDDWPGQWVESPMARCLFARMGGTDWASTRQFIYGRDRGEVGRLALAVAEAADLGDAEAASLLRRAGVEIGRLGAVLHRRFGAKPVVAAGRVLLLHPLVGQGVRAGLPADCPLELKQIDPSMAAAQRARALWGVGSPGDSQEARG